MPVDLSKLAADTTVWLTPKTIGAPRVCWREPRAHVVRVEHPYVVVLVAGAEHRVHVDNVRTTEPAAARGVDRPARPKPPPQWDGYEQPTVL
uniref:hypothetical protein n=1 Tax=Actinoplanes sp. CA-084688 TaxID=3239901 RepID=UPI003F495CCE